MASFVVKAGVSLLKKFDILSGGDEGGTKPEEGVAGEREAEGAPPAPETAAGVGGGATAGCVAASVSSGREVSVSTEDIAPVTAGEGAAVGERDAGDASSADHFSLHGWLLSLRPAALVRYEDVLTENGFDEVESLAELTEAHVKEMGVRLAHRKPLLQAALALRLSIEEAASQDGAFSLLRWLRAEPDMSRYESLLRENGYDSKVTLASLTEGRLAELGVLLAHRPLLLDKAAALAGEHGLMRRVRARSTVESHSWHDVKFAELDIIAKAGEGVSGIVQRGRWRGMDVCIKQLKRSTVDQVKELQMEADVMARVCNHENVVDFVGVSTDGPRLAIVTRFMDKGSADRVVAKEELSLEQLTSMACDAVAGLLHLHHEHIIHRDVAARNLLVDEHYRVKVSDFGFSLADEGHVEDADALRPIRWMAPEALMHSDYSKASDVWSMGMALSEMFTGEKPWIGLSNAQAAREITHGSPMPLPDSMRPELCAILRSCWAFIPSDRLTADSLLRRLMAFRALLRAPSPAFAAPAEEYDTWRPGDDGGGEGGASDSEDSLGGDDLEG